MKPVVLSLAAAVLLLISLANHRHESCPDERFTAPTHNYTTSQPSADDVTNDKSTIENYSEPVSFSGKNINFFITY